MRYSILFIFILLLFPTPSWSQENLTWSQAVEEAGRNNPDLKAALFTVRKGESDVKVARSDFFPQLSLQSNFNAGDDLSTGIDETNFAPRRELSASAGLRENLFAGFKTKAGYDKSRALLTDSQLAFVAALAQLTFDLRSSFARLLFAQQRLTLAKNILERRRENARLIELRYEGGSENKGSLLRSQALSQQADYDVREAERALESGQTELARFLGRSNPAAQRLRAQGDLTTVAPPKSPDLHVLAAATPDVRRAATQIRVSKADVRIARGDLFPTVDASASVDAATVTGDSDRDGWSTGLVLSYPLALGGKDFHEVRGAKANQRKSEVTLQSVAYRIESELKQAWVNFQNAVERIRVQQGFLQAARVRAQIARSQYANGLTSFFDWDQIETDLIQNEKTMLETSRDAVLAEAQWEKVQGKGAW